MMRTKGIALIALIFSLLTINNKTMAQGYTFPEFSYAYNALGPYIDTQTMEIHYSKHHRAYFDNFVKVAAENKIDDLSLTGIFAKISTLPAVIRNNGGGFYNHNLFWNVMDPNAGGKPEEDLLEAINKTFGSFDAFKTEFETAAKTQFGSGWAWLAVNADGKLFVSQTPNQDNPLMDVATKRGKNFWARSQSKFQGIPCYWRNKKNNSGIGLAIRNRALRCILAKLPSGSSSY